MVEPEYRLVPLVDIFEPEAAIRSAMDPSGLRSLADSIASVGQLHPLSVYPDGEKLRIAAGHRRFCALDLLGATSARCLVYASAFEAMLAVQIAENVEHEDMKPTDEAIWFARLLEGLQLDTTRLAEQLKMSRNYIEGRLALLAGDPVVFAAVHAQKISLGVGHALNDFPNEHLRHAYLDMAIHREATVATVEKWCAEAIAIERLREMTADAPATTPAATDDELTPPVMVCDVCGDSDEPWTMVMVWNHTRCKKLRERMLAAAVAASEGAHG